MQIRLFEIVSDVDHINIEEIVKVMDDRKPFRDYAYILHDKDTYTEDDEARNPLHKAGTIKKAHYHIAVRLSYGVEIKYVSDWLGVPANFINRVKGKWVDMLKYLTHENASGKHQYGENEVTSNYDWKKDKDMAVSKLRGEDRKSQIINDIVNGVIREFNYNDYITIDEYDKYKKSIDNAFKYRTDKIKGGKRDMDCVYITGKSGTGKSTYAKMMCEDKNYSYFISSGSNDVLDGYAGQDCIILDDLRPSCMGLSDLLKMLDNNTASTVKSRYKNKVLECKLVIITSVLKIDEFFNGVFKEHKEPIVQLKRRCKLHLRFENDCYYACLFDETIGDYSAEYEYKNPVAQMFPKVVLSKEERLEFINNMLVAGAEFTGSEAPATSKTENAVVDNKTGLISTTEECLQNQVNRLYKHNQLLMDKLDSAS